MKESFTETNQGRIIHKETSMQVHRKTSNFHQWCSSCTLIPAKTSILSVILSASIHGWRIDPGDRIMCLRVQPMGLLFLDKIWIYGDMVIAAMSGGAA